MSTPPPVAVPPLGPQSWMFAGTRHQANQLAYNPASNQADEVTKQVAYTPDYPVANPRWAFAPWFLSATVGAELDAGAPITIAGARIEVDGVGYPLTVNGSPTWTMNPGAPGVWTDPLPITLQPRTRYVAWTYAQFTVGVANAGLGSFCGDPTKGEFVRQGTAGSLAATFAGTALAGTLNDGALFGHAPIAMVAQGNDGRRVFLVPADSIGTHQGGSDINVDGRGNKSWVGKWLDSTLNGAIRYPYQIWGVAGGANNQVTTAANYQRRAALLALLPNVPFTDVINQMYVNDVNATTATWQSRITTHNGVIKALWPKAKIIQLGSTPWCTSDNNNFTTVAGQTYAANHDWPTGSTQQTQLALSAMPTNVDAFIHTEPYWDGTFAAAGGTLGKWRTDLTTFSDTLFAAASIADTFIQLNKAPALGSIIVVDPGTASAESFIVKSVTGIGAPYKVTVKHFGWAGTVSTAHLINAVVKGAPSAEGIHPGDELVDAVVALLAPLKATVLA